MKLNQLGKLRKIKVFSPRLYPSKSQMRGQIVPFSFFFWRLCCDESNSLLLLIYNTLYVGTNTLFSPWSLSLRLLFLPLHPLPCVPLPTYSFPSLTSLFLFPFSSPSFPFSRPFSEQPHYLPLPLLPSHIYVTSNPSFSKDKKSVGLMKVLLIPTRVSEDFLQSTEID